MAETNSSYVATNETSTTMDAGNSTDILDQNLSGEHEDSTVSVVLIPLVVIGLLITVAAIIFLVIRRKTTKQARRQFAPVYYSVEHEESGNEWESQLMEEESGKHASIVKPKPTQGRQARLQFERGGT